MQKVKGPHSKFNILFQGCIVAKRRRRRETDLKVQDGGRRREVRRLNISRQIFETPSCDDVVCDQCDQIPKLSFQYGGININENLTKIIKNCPIRFQILPNAKKLSQNSQRLLNFCQSGKISPNLVTISFATETGVSERLRKMFLHSFNFNVDPAPMDMWEFFFRCCKNARKYLLSFSRQSFLAETI